MERIKDFDNKNNNKSKKKCIFELEKNFERILNDYGVDTKDKERALKKYLNIFELNGEK